MHNAFLTQVEESRESTEALIIIRGYRSENNFTQGVQAEWRWALRDAGWQGSIHYLWWDSSNDSIINLARNVQHWKQMKDRAKRVGRDHLPNLVSSHLSKKSCSIVGYSLGAYVTYYAMREWTRALIPLNNVILLGGAARRDKEWGQVTENSTGRTINVYNSCDFHLSATYRVGELLFSSSPCGVKPIEVHHSRITNIDATHVVGESHDEVKYLKAMKQLVGHRLWAC